MAQKGNRCLRLHSSKVEQGSVAGPPLLQVMHGRSSVNVCCSCCDCWLGGGADGDRTVLVSSSGRPFRSRAALLECLPFLWNSLSRLLLFSWTETDGLRTSWNSFLALVKSHILKSQSLAFCSLVQRTPDAPGNHWTPCPCWLKGRLPGHCCGNPGSSMSADVTLFRGGSDFAHPATLLLGGIGQH